MKEFEFTQYLFETNCTIIARYETLLQRSIKTLDWTNTEEIKRVYDLRITLNEIKKNQEKLTERLQISAEEEK